jgi:serine/threonine protein kinase
MTTRVVKQTYKLGSGSYAAVYGASLDEDEDVAIKIGDIALIVCQTTLREGLLSKLGYGPKFRGLFVDAKDRYVGFATDVAVGNLQKWQYHYSTIYASNILYFAQSVLETLSRLHDNDIVHCDIKPSNILLMSDGSVKLCDFGLSMKATTDTKHFDHTFTPNYRPPELLLTSQPWSILKSADIWALGITLYFFLNPFGICGASKTKDVKELVSLTIPNDYDECVDMIFDFMSERNEHATRLAEVIATCLRWSPEERPSAKNLLQIIRGYIPRIPDTTIGKLPCSPLFCNYRVIHLEYQSLG